MNKVFKRSSNGYQKDSHDGQRFKMKSRVVPDQSLTPKELLHRYAKGLPLGGYDPNAALWDEDNDGIDVRKLDLVDIQLKQEEIKDKLDIIAQREKAAEKERIKNESEALGQ